MTINVDDLAAAISQLPVHDRQKLRPHFGERSEAASDSHLERRCRRAGERCEDYELDGDRAARAIVGRTDTALVEGAPRATGTLWIR
jgi:hypothetical protein